jgi:PAS domain S-box-containing protein
MMAISQHPGRQCNVAEFEQQALADFLLQSPLPWWEWHFPRNIIQASPLKAGMLGYDPADFSGKGYNVFTDIVHAEDYARTMRAMADLLEGRQPIFQVDYRILAADGRYHWYMDRGAILSRLPDGTPEIIRGVVLDLGAHIRPTLSADELLELLRDALPAADDKSGVIKLCSSCLRMRSGNIWLDITPELAEFLAQRKSHGLCTDCLHKLYPEYAEKISARLGLK